MKSGRIVLGILGIALVVGMAFTGTALAQGPWGDQGAGTGVCDAFVDENNDGICDTMPEGRPFAHSDSEDWMGGGYGAGGAGAMGAGVDADGDGFCDVCGEEFVDENNDGICDNMPEGRPLVRKDSEDWVAGGGYRAGGAGMRGAYGDADGDGLCDRTGEPFVDENNDGICDNAPETGLGRGRMATQES